MKVVLVDDERIAIDHIRSLIPWEHFGFEIAATATNGKSALRLCQELLPQIMIVDIRMPVMDGLELIRSVTEQNLDVIFIVMSAYEDFEYARQAISLGSVSSYLIKHEVDRDKLLEELRKAKAAWETAEEQRQIRRGEQIKSLLTEADRTVVSKFIKFAPPFGLISIHADAPFSSGPADSASFNVKHPVKWSREETSLCSANADWRLIGHFPVDVSHTFALFAFKNKTSCAARVSLGELASTLQSQISQRHEQTVSVFFGIHADEQASLPAAFRKLLIAGRFSIFSGPGSLLCTDDLPLPGQAGVLPSRHFQFDPLHEAIKQRDVEGIQNAVHKLLVQPLQPTWDLRGLHEVVAGLTTVVNEYRGLIGMPEIDPFDPKEYEPVYRIDGIASRFARLLADYCVCSNDSGKISNKMSKALNYIHDHFHEDINIEDVSYSTGISASYLHQIFKRELDRTFLDYLTAYRIEQAKRILRLEDAKMTEVATRVGYRSPQHFSQVFKKMTGTLPHQYRDGGYRS